MILNFGFSTGFLIVNFNQKKSNIEGERDLSIEENGKFNNKKIRCRLFYKSKNFIYLFFLFFINIITYLSNFNHKIKKYYIIIHLH